MIKTVKLLLIVALSISLLISACSSDSGEGDGGYQDGFQNDGADNGEQQDNDFDLPCSLPEDCGTILNPTHTGWQNRSCANCHDISATKHDPYWRIPDCAQCHGANGACSTEDLLRTHYYDTDICVACHNPAPYHLEYSDSADCVKCHFAQDGTAECN